jgi:hypothetical protein
MRGGDFPCKTGIVPRGGKQRPMFFFNRPKPTNASIRWDKTDWKFVKEENEMRYWGHTKIPEIMREVFKFGSYGNLPSNWRAPGIAENYFQEIAKKTEKVAIETEIVDLRGIAGVKSVFKGPDDRPTGMFQYWGVLVLPFNGFFYMVQFISHNHQPNDERPSVVMAMTVNFEQRDPRYFSKQPLQRMPYDEPEWDSMFPTHPLSRVRRYLTHVENTLEVDDAVRKAKPFGS